MDAPATTDSREISPASHQSSNDEWIDRVEHLFRRFEDFWGAKWAAQYGALPRERVIRTWARELSAFADQPERLRHATRIVCESQWPPTLPEMIAAARAAPKPDAPIALPHRMSTDEMAAALQRSREVAEQAARSTATAGRDCLGWARRPGSAHAMSAVFVGARTDARLADIAAQHVAAGNADESGRALRVWRNGGWA